MTRQLALYRGGEALVRLLPGPVSVAAAGALGSILGRAPDLDGRRRLVASHMSRVAGRTLRGTERSLAVNRVYSYYARYWAESLRLPWLPADEVVAGVTTEGECHIDDGLAAGRGVIIAAPHLGGWEWGARYLVARGIEVTVAVEELEPTDVFEWFVAYRERLGVNVVPVGAKAGPAILRALKHNHVVCLLSDRVVGQSAGVDVEFFGGRTQLPAGPVTLAARSGAPIVPAAIFFGRGCDDHHIVFRPPLTLGGPGRLRDVVAGGVQQLAGELEQLIQISPTQWHLLQPNWPDDPPLRGLQTDAQPGRPCRYKRPGAP